MRDAALTALGFVDGRTRTDLDLDPMLEFALVRALELIGEGASRIPDDVRAEAPGIRWAQIVGLRNRLIHGYDSVDLDVVWAVVATDVPDLVAQLNRLIGSGP
jgi:uncharacterized protein with HEPN domain